MSKILVTGSASGLGLLISEELVRQGHDVFAFDVSEGEDVRDPQGTYGAPPAGLDVLINCAGINRINWLQDVTDAEFDAVMDVNAKAIFTMTQWALEELKLSRGTVLNIVSNAAHMPMRSSLAYNMSKAAALMATKQLARELTSQGITVFSVSPNKLKGTGMSDDIDRQVVKTRGWTVEQAQQYQLAGLLTGEETDPQVVAEFVAYLLKDKRAHKHLSGCDMQVGL